MMGELIARNLLHRPLRTFIGIMAVAVEVALVVLIVGLTSGLLAESAKRIQGIGADIVFQPPAASIFLGFSGSPMPMKIGEKLETLKYVQAVAPALAAIQFDRRRRDRSTASTRIRSAPCRADSFSCTATTWKAPTTCSSTIGKRARKN